MGTRWSNRLGRQVLKNGVLSSITTEDEPLTTIVVCEYTRKHNPSSQKMVTLALSSTPRVGDSAIEKIEVKLTHLKKINK